MTSLAKTLHRATLIPSLVDWAYERPARAWLFLIPALVLVAGSALLPLMAVVNYSLHYLTDGCPPEWAGLSNFQDMLSHEPGSFGVEFWSATRRQFLFTFCVLAVQIPLGLGIALCLPKKGWGMTFSLLLLGIPLLIPWSVVGIVWRVFTRPDLGAVPLMAQAVGYDYQPGSSVTDAWWTTVAMDTWHWTPLVALLCVAGLKTIPEPCFRAAAIDGAGAWAVFRHVILPRLKYVLTLAVLLRTMDSFNIFIEPRILTGGGTGTTFLSIYAANFTFDKGLLSALSILYLFLVVVLCYVLFTTMKCLGEQQDSQAVKNHGAV